ncbi:hypothetical protein ADK61_37405 [Streptomyces sp. XY66]|nr:hypothetical protein ADK61_37405 [Streptomyces sp. XY66]
MPGGGDAHVVAAAVGGIAAAFGESFALQVVEDPDATLKAAGAVGLVAGLWVTPLGVAAAVGVTLYFVGAVVSHLRVKDYELAPAAVLALVAAAALVLRILA